LAAATISVHLIYPANYDNSWYRVDTIWAEIRANRLNGESLRREPFGDDSGVGFEINPDPGTVAFRCPQYCLPRASVHEQHHPPGPAVSVRVLAVDS
jgi:hypothetical protein